MQAPIKPATAPAPPAARPGIRAPRPPELRLSPGPAPARPPPLQRLRAARWLWLPLLAFAITRLGIALVAYAAEPLIANAPNEGNHLYPNNVLLDVFGSRWDTGFFLSIAMDGYYYPVTEGYPSVPFFPLLPLLMRLGVIFTGDLLLAGLLASNAALLAASLLLYRLADAEWGPAVAGRAVWYLLIFPTSFFGSALYSESLFLFCAIGSLVLARRGAWESAGRLGALGALSRLLGILIAPMLLAEWWLQRRRRLPPDRPPAWAVLAPAIVLLGTGAYMLYLWRTFGDPLAFAHASAEWGRVPSSPLAAVAGLFQRPADGWRIGLLSGRIPLDNWIDLAVALFFLALGGVLLLQRRWSEGLFVTLGTFIPFCSGLLMSQRRYVWVLFPAFILLARWGGRPWVDRAITALSLLGLGLFTAMFANWYWVG